MRIVTMTPDEADRAIAAEIAAMPPELHPAARTLADLMPRTAQAAEWLRALRVDGFLVFPHGTVEVDGVTLKVTVPKDH